MGKLICERHGRNVRQLYVSLGIQQALRSDHAPPPIRMLRVHVFEPFGDLADGEPDLDEIIAPQPMVVDVEAAERIAAIQSLDQPVSWHTARDAGLHWTVTCHWCFNEYLARSGVVAISPIEPVDG